MKHLLIALILVIFTGAAWAGDNKATYHGQSLVGSTVGSLVAKFATHNDQSPPDDLSEVLILVNGRRTAITRQEADGKIVLANAVEILGKDGDFVVNIITK